MDLESSGFRNIKDYWFRFTQTSTVLPGIANALKWIKNWK
jgi:hypothetical protein